MHHTRLTAVATGLIFAMGISGAQAAATGQLSSIVDWDTLSTSGDVSFVSITEGGNTFSASSDVEVSLTGWGQQWTSAYDDATAALTASAPGASIEAGVNNGGEQHGPGDDYVQASIYNDGNGVVQGAGFTYTNRFFTANATGQVSFSIDYDLSLLVGADTDGFNWASAGYELLFSVGSVDTFFALLPELGEDAAGEAAFVTGTSASAQYSIWSGCVLAGDCGPDAFNGSGTLTLTAMLNAGETYWIDTDNSAWLYTDSVAPSAVPVPAAVWLLGSGLVGLVGVARRRVV